MSGIEIALAASAALSAGGAVLQGMQSAQMYNAQAAAADMQRLHAGQAAIEAEAAAGRARLDGYQTLAAGLAVLSEGVAAQTAAGVAAAQAAQKTTEAERERTEAARREQARQEDLNAALATQAALGAARGLDVGGSPGTVAQRTAALVARETAIDRDRTAAAVADAELGAIAHHIQAIGQQGRADEAAIRAALAGLGAETSFIQAGLYQRRAGLSLMTGAAYGAQADAYRGAAGAAPFMGILAGAGSLLRGYADVQRV